MENELFPSVKRSIHDFINDEEAAIPRGKLLAVGSLMLVLSVILGVDAAAKHTSHRSHSSHSSSSYHRSHTSHSSHRSGHGSHSSHSNHGSHSNTHGSHSSHSNTHSSHSSHSSTAVTTTKPAVTTTSTPATTTTATVSKPALSSIPSPAAVSEISPAEISTDAISAKLSTVSAPTATPGTDEVSAALSMPLPTPEFSADSPGIQPPIDGNKK